MNIVAGHADDTHGKQSLRLWIQLLQTTTLIEKTVRSFLRTDCASTLPRFDVLAALYRENDKLTMSELSDRLLVSNGNVTGIVARLADDGLVDRETDSSDRRSQLVYLTRAGRSAFRRMAKMHEDLIDNIFGDLESAEIEQTLRLMTRLKASVCRGDASEARSA